MMDSSCFNWVLRRVAEYAYKRTLHKRLLFATRTTTLPQQHVDVCTRCHCWYPAVSTCECLWENANEIIVDVHPFFVKLAKSLLALRLPHQISIIRSYYNYGERPNGLRTCTNCAVVAADPIVLCAQLGCPNIIACGREWCTSMYDSCTLCHKKFCGAHMNQCTDCILGVCDDCEPSIGCPYCPTYLCFYHRKPTIPVYHPHKGVQQFCENDAKKCEEVSRISNTCSECNQLQGLLMCTPTSDRCVRWVCSHTVHYKEGDHRCDACRSVKKQRIE